jgi:uncharacterized glyoxalase superfamily protein PhnB
MSELEAVCVFQTQRCPLREDAMSAVATDASTQIQPAPVFGWSDPGHRYEKPQSFNQTPQVKDIDFWWARAVEAGATVVMPIEKMFWGDHYGQLRDPFGIMWSINEPGA